MLTIPSFCHLGVVYVFSSPPFPGGPWFCRRLPASYILSPLSPPLSCWTGNISLPSTTGPRAQLLWRAPQRAVHSCLKKETTCVPEEQTIQCNCEYRHWFHNSPEIVVAMFLHELKFRAFDLVIQAPGSWISKQLTSYSILHSFLLFQKCCIPTKHYLFNILKWSRNLCFSYPD